jgi:hypothetical protein
MIQSYHLNVVLLLTRLHWTQTNEGTRKTGVFLLERAFHDQTDLDKAYEHDAGAKLTVTGNYETTALNDNFFKLQNDGERICGR